MASIAWAIIPISLIASMTTRPRTPSTSTPSRWPVARPSTGRAGNSPPAQRTRSSSRSPIGGATGSGSAIHRRRWGSDAESSDHPDRRDPAQLGADAAGRASPCPRRPSALHPARPARALRAAYDAVYGSAIFKFSADRVARFRDQFPGAIVGGTPSDLECRWIRSRRMCRFCWPRS